ncbi:MAG: peptide chain release factor N(5)-glutamine methyltransferase [Acidimicrobiales bacterium]
MSSAIGPDPGTVTWAEVSRGARARLVQAGREDPGWDVRLLVAEVTGTEPGDYLEVTDRPAGARALSRFDSMVERLLTGEPLQYVVGHWSFRTLELMVDRRVLIPRPETETVVSVALAEAQRLIDRHGHTYQRRITLADLGTGSGAIALSLAAECKVADVWATDTSEPALAVARANLAGLGQPGARVQLRHGHWFAALPAALAGNLAVVVSNPPYVGDDELLPAEVADWEPALALRGGPDGLHEVRTLVAQAPVWLRDDGVLVLELAPTQMPAARDLAAAAGFREVRVETDLAGRERTLVARR